MSKISKNIQMLNILSSGKKYTCKQLSEILEISPRMIRTYKDELEKEGIYIDTIYGKEGGYVLRSKIELPLILFNENDIATLDLLIEKNNDVELLRKLNDLKQKIANYCRLLKDDYNILDKEKIEILEDIKKAIIENKSIKIEYFSKNIKKE